MEPAQSLVGLGTDPATPNRCDVILWGPQQQLPVLAEVPQTAPVTAIVPPSGPGRNIALVDLLIWDAEGNAAQPKLQYLRPAAGNWANATIAAIDGLAYPHSSFVATDPTGRLHQVSWDAARDLGAGFTNTVTLRARAQDNTLLGEWSPPVSYTVHNSVANLLAVDDSATTPMNTPVTIDVLANDIGAPRLLAGVGVPAHGSATTNLNQTVRYTPAADFVGTDRFIYWLTDGAGASRIATVTVVVTEGVPTVVLVSPNLEGSDLFGMTIQGLAGQVYRVQVSTNLATWTDVQTVTNVTGSVSFAEQVPTDAPARFYRARVETP